MVLIKLAREDIIQKSINRYSRRKTLRSLVEEELYDPTVDHTKEEKTALLWMRDMLEEKMNKALDRVVDVHGDGKDD
jgi:hypothetical protein